MNVERLREVIDQLMTAESQYNIQVQLTQVRDYLQQLVQNPQQPQLQTQLAASLDLFRRRVKEFITSFTHVQMKNFGEIRATEVFVRDMATEIDQLIHDNPMTPQVALDKINDIVQKRQAYLELLRDLQNKLQELGIEGSKIEPGQAEIGVLLPRQLFQNHLAELINELRAINRVIRTFAEVATGAPEPVEVHQTSTSDPVFSSALAQPQSLFLEKL
jgi:hypothetical protein